MSVKEYKNRMRIWWFVIHQKACSKVIHSITFSKLFEMLLATVKNLQSRWLILSLHAPHGVLRPYASGRLIKRSTVIKMTTNINSYFRDTKPTVFFCFERTWVIINFIITLYELYAIFCSYNFISWSIFSTPLQIPSSIYRIWTKTRAYSTRTRQVPVLRPIRPCQQWWVRSVTRAQYHG